MMMQAGYNCKLGIRQPSTKSHAKLQPRMRSTQKRIDCSSYTLDQPETKHVKQEAIQLPQASQIMVAAVVI